MKNLAGLHERANTDEKRILVENCFSNRIVAGRNVDLEPQNWLQKVSAAQLTPNGAPFGDTSRTFGGERGLRKLMELIGQS